MGISHPSLRSRSWRYHLPRYTKLAGEGLESGDRLGARGETGLAPEQTATDLEILSIEMAEAKDLAAAVVQTQVVDHAEGHAAVQPGRRDGGRGRRR